MEKEIKQLGHQAPKGWRSNDFNSIELKDDLAYCASHHFVYDSEKEKEKLYNGQPCYYTDSFEDGNYNFFKQCNIYWTRWKSISLKSAIRRTLKIKGIPIGTIVEFGKSYYHRGKKFSNSFLFKIKKENPINIEFKVTRPSYFKNFTSCERSQKLTDLLRANGFLVQVLEDNDNFISSMISTAASYTGKNIEVTKEPGEVGIAYGHGKKIGFSSYDNTVFGYGNGCESILWDHFGYFDKWSRCNEISKNTSIEEIVDILINEKPEEY